MDVSERLKITMMAADRSRRAALSRILYSRALRWRFGSTAIDQLVIVPQDLRTADPSFWREIELGQFGLAGTAVVLHGRSPFEISPPNEAWLRSLHGFGWLRHLDAAGNPEAREFARRITVEWIIRQRNETPQAWEPGVMGRRLISWLSYASLLLDGADSKSYDTITQSLGMQLVRLSATWREGAEGHPRILGLIALVLADLSIAGHDRQLREAERLLARELSRQLLRDGGHVSRNPSILIELMLDILPLRQCFVARDRRPPPELAGASQRMLAILRFMRMGDGTLARFNGVSVASPAGLATVLAYDDRQEPITGLAPFSKYARLEGNKTVVICDVGAPPPLSMSGDAQAGCLSFEMSSGAHLIFVNGGVPGAADHDWRVIARATASHNTLCLADSSSALLVRDPALERLMGVAALKLPEHVNVEIRSVDLGTELVASHDGYRDRYGLIHQRQLLVEHSGRVRGIDRLDGARVRVRLRKDLPFSIHFHLHPDVKCSGGDQPGTFIIGLSDGETWRFTVEGAGATIEESIYFADSAGPVRSLQIVVRGVTFGETEVKWAMEPAT
jgi:uncharacterized heparinase superfamily protein